MLVCQFMLVYGSLCQFMLVYVSLCQFMLVCQFMLAYVSSCQFMLVYVSLCQFVSLWQLMVVMDGSYMGNQQYSLLSSTDHSAGIAGKQKCRLYIYIYKLHFLQMMFVVCFTNGGMCSMCYTNANECVNINVRIYINYLVY